MEKLPMCRICLVENVRMYAVVSKNMQDLYESLTHIPFVTEDTRPTLACFFCYAKLKQCCQLQRQCLEAEELFAQMMNEPNPSINRGQLELFNGLVKTQVVNISIDGVGQMEQVAIKEELPVYYEGLEDVIEPKEEPHSNDIKLENTNNGFSDVEDTPLQHSSHMNAMEIKIEVEEVQELLEEKSQATDTRWPTAVDKPKDTRRIKLGEVIPEEQMKTDYFSKGASAAEKPKEDTRRTKLGEVIPEEQMKIEKPDTKNTQTTQNRTRRVKFKKPHKCDVCQISFVCKSHLVRHFYTHTGEKPYKCDICQRSFNRKSYLTVHIRQHTGEKPYKCDTCHNGYSNKGDLLRHIRTHTGERLYKCDVCQRYFSKNNHLKIHSRMHSGEKPYTCNTCQYECNNRSDLLKHIRTHTGEKPYKCEVCQRSFSRKSHLTLHFRMHTGDKPFKCDTCPYGCNSRADLLKHVRKHTGEKPYKCDVCHRSFARKNTFTRHLLTHTGEKPCELDRCKVSINNIHKH